MPPANIADFSGVIGSQAARKKALVTNMTNAAGAPKHLHAATPSDCCPIDISDGSKESVKNPESEEIGWGSAITNILW